MPHVYLKLRETKTELVTFTTDDLRARLRLAALAIQQDCRRQRGLRVLERHCEQRRCEPTTAFMIAEPEQLHDEEHMRRMQHDVRLRRSVGVLPDALDVRQLLDEVARRSEERRVG